MYRLLSASKDTYITSKFIQGNSSSVNANMGQASSIDLYHLFDETTVPGVPSPITEASKGLIKFDLTELRTLVSSGYVDISQPDFQCFVSMKDIYGGQTTPSNFTLSLYPLAKDWDEGTGIDVVAYRDKDTCNFLTASMNFGSPVLWSMPGANNLGPIGSPTADVYSMGDLGSGVTQSLARNQRFDRGDENLFIDVTDIVSATLAGILPDNGFRLSYSAEEEKTEVTYFVKRFGTKHTDDKSLHPKLVVKYNDSIVDESGMPQFNVSQSFFLYNRDSLTDKPKNLSFNSVPVTGSNSLIFELHSSKSVSFVTTSWSMSHSASINWVTKSLSYFSQSFTGSQYKNQTGIYYADINLDSLNGPLNVWLSGSDKKQKFRGVWKSLDGSVSFSPDQHYVFENPTGIQSNVSKVNNLVVNITNLKDLYLKNNTDQGTRLRVFVQDYNLEQVATKIPSETRATILSDMLWGLRQPFTNKVIIPFDQVATKVSADKNGMYFDLHIEDLDANEVYQIDLLVNGDLLIRNPGFRFKVVSYL